MLRISQELREAKQRKSARPDGGGFTSDHELIAQNSSREPVIEGEARTSNRAKTSTKRSWKRVGERFVRSIFDPGYPDFRIDQSGFASGMIPVGRNSSVKLHVEESYSIVVPYQAHSLVRICAMNKDADLS